MIMKSRTLKKLLTEDWIIVFAGAVILALATIFPEAVPSMPEKLTSASDWLSAGYLFLFVLILTYLTSAALLRPLKGIFISLLLVFILTIAARLIAAIPIVKEFGFEPVFFAVILGLLVIAWMSLSPLLNEGSPFWQFRSQMHTYLTIVVGTLVIFCTGFIVTAIAEKKGSRAGADIQ